MGGETRRSNSAGESVWLAPVDWRSRYRLWRQGARQVRREWASYDDISVPLADLGVDIVPYRVDVPAFWRYVDECRYREMTYWDGGRARAGTEKWLEHFVSIDLLRPGANDVLIDIASSSSPFPDIVRERWQCRTYRHDLLYPAGRTGDRIGSDAADLPIADESVDGLTLHCSFEHLEGDRDIGFLREADRVLRPGGQLCIVPIYFNRTYCIQTDLRAWHAHAPDLGRDALVCVAAGWGDVHGRFYDPEQFAERILNNLGRLRVTLYTVENYLDVAQDCYLKFVAVFRKT